MHLEGDAFNDSEVTSSNRLVIQLNQNRTPAVVVVM